VAITCIEMKQFVLRFLFSKACLQYFFVVFVVVVVVVVLDKNVLHVCNFEV